MSQSIIEILTDLRSAGHAIAKDLSGWPEHGPRLIDEGESVVSVLLAILCAHVVGAQNVGWAAFSGYMVMRSHVKESLGRGALRVIGTAAGAALAWCLSARVASSALLSSVALMLIGFVTLYFAMVSRRSYAWLFAGLTFSMVLIDGMQHPGGSVEGFAWSRFIEVLTGTCACVCVSGLSTYAIRCQLPGGPGFIARAAPARIPRSWHSGAFQHAVQGAIALALIPWVWRWFAIESLVQSSITVMAVMMVPLSGLSAERHPTSAKLLHRFTGCGIGGALATLILLISHDVPLVMTFGVCVGVVIGRHIENGKLGISYIGTQFALAFLVVLVPDSYSGVDIGPGLDRLFGIMFGMALLEPVRLAWRSLIPARKT